MPLREVVVKQQGVLQIGTLRSDDCDGKDNVKKINTFN